MTTTEKFIRDLGACASEEAVKATFIKYAGFSAYIREKVDLFVDPVLFEFKYDVNLRTSWPKVLAQALTYVYRIREGVISLPMPTHIVLVDKNEALMLPLSEPLKELLDGSYKWSAAASSPCPKLVKAVASIPGLPSTLYDITKPNDLERLITDVASADSQDADRKKVVSVQNFDSVFQEWQTRIGSAITGASSLGPYFISDLREDTVFNGKTGKLAFQFNGEIHQVPAKAYSSFWAMYARPPAADVQDLIMQRMHMFAPEKKRKHEGAFYTPRWVAVKALEYLDRDFPGWRDDPDTYIYDPCCGTGNLEYPMRDFSRVFMSTLDMAEVLLLKGMNAFPGAEIFQFDFLNRDYLELPETLRKVAEDPGKRLIILMNPPYAAAGLGVGMGIDKAGVSDTAAREHMDGCGLAQQEIFVQFLHRANAWFPGSVIGCFSTLKYVVSPGCQKFRDTAWKNRGFVSGFIFDGRAFNGVKGKFPIGFLVWTPAATGKAVTVDVFDKKGVLWADQPTKIYPTSCDYLNDWFLRPDPRSGAEAVPLVSALTSAPASNQLFKTKLTADAVGTAVIHSNDPQHSTSVCTFSGLSSSAHSVLITPSTFDQIMVQVAVRRLVADTWINHTDQYQVPDCDKPTYLANRAPGNTALPRDFIADCVVYNLFSGHNQTSCWDPEYKGKTWHVANEFWPWAAAEALPWLSHDLDRTRQLQRAKPTFVSQWLQTNQVHVTPEAAAVLDAGRALYKLFYAELPSLLQKQYHLQYYNPGFYQVRKSMEQADVGTCELEAVKAAVNTLKAKLLPKVYGLGFLVK